MKADQKLHYKSFPKGDARRFLAALYQLALFQGSDKATVHYVAIAIDCTRAEAQRALAAVSVQFGVRYERDGSRYKIVDWGVLKQSKLRAFLVGEMKMSELTD